MKKDITKWTRKELLALPFKGNLKVGRYHGVAIVPTYDLHDSGWRLMALVGLDDEYNPVEIAAYCDDIQWRTPKNDCGLHCDMIPKTNIVRFHSSNLFFEIGLSCSTTDIKVYGDTYCYQSI